MNTATPGPVTNTSTSLLHLTLEEEREYDLTEDVDDIMDWVFGDMHEESSNTQCFSDFED